MSKIQCPNCGEYKVRSSELNVGCMTLYFLVGSLITCKGLTTYGMSSDLGVPNLYLWGGIVIIIVGLLYLIGYRNYARKHHECLICGNKWQTPQ